MLTRLRVDPEGIMLLDLGAGTVVLAEPGHATDALVVVEMEISSLRGPPAQDDVLTVGLRRPDRTRDRGRWRHSRPGYAPPAPGSDWEAEWSSEGERREHGEGTRTAPNRSSG